MTPWHLYRTTDGTFTGGVVCVPEADLELNVPDGHAAISGALVNDWQAQRVDLATGAVIAWKPPEPEGDEWRQAVWDESARRWVWQETPAAVERAARDRRDQLLAASDWVTLRAVDTGQPVPQVWLDYRAALRDLPDAMGWPGDVAWPEVPSSV